MIWNFLKVIGLKFLSIMKPSIKKMGLEFQYLIIAT